MLSKNSECILILGHRVLKTLELLQLAFKTKGMPFILGHCSFETSLQSALNKQRMPFNLGQRVLKSLNILQVAFKKSSVCL
jgi:hypothetical protein